MTANVAPVTGQLALDIHPLQVPDLVEGATIQERFDAFHDLNPWVLVALERLAEDYLARGRRRIGVKMLFEVLRWQYGRATRGDEFRLNNNFTSRYVRLMLARHPDWEDAFHTRSLKTA